jgi:GNAT superfamily N-acetyltransferase
MAGVIDPIEFVPPEASPEDWGRYHAFRRRQQAESRPEEPLTPDAAAERLMLRRNPRKEEHRWQVTRGEEIVSVLEADAVRPESPEYETNRHLLWAAAYVLAGHRGHGIGRGWLPTVIDLMDRHGATVLSTAADTDPGHTFLRALGAEPKLVERQSRLDLGQVDWDMVAGWVRDGAAASPRSELALYPSRLPDDMLDGYCAALNDLLNTMPFEDLDHGEIVITPAHVRDYYEELDVLGSDVHTCVVWEANGSIAGMTDVIKHPHEAGLVRQEFTGVHPRARGRGIGKWLKAAMLGHIRQAHPETVTVTTENAGSNAPMLAINEALGFRMHRVVTFYQVDRETLGRAV